MRLHRHGHNRRNPKSELLERAHAKALARRKDTNGIQERKRRFNEFQAQSRLRWETTLKLIFLINGSMLTVSIAPFLGTVPPAIPNELLMYLKYSWFLLFFSIAAGIVNMAAMIVATYHMGVQMAAKLADSEDKPDLIFTAQWLRYFNMVVFLLIVFSCISGIALMAMVALGVAVSVPTVPSFGGIQEPLTLC